MTSPALLDTLLKGGTPGLILVLVLIVYALARGILVPGYAYREIATKLARYEDLAYKAVTSMERVTERQERERGT